MTVVGVLVAGALGAVARFVLDGAVRTRWATVFPWATVLINISGSLLLGFLAGLVTYHTAPVDLQHILGTGFCGGYTTFSTASVESARLAQRRHSSLVVLNMFGQMIVAAGACALGLVAAWAI